MATKDEHIRLDAFKVGAEYSRPEVAVLGQVTVPESIFATNWSQGIVEFANAAVLFVSLEKTHYDYQDYFEGAMFWWQSQNRQTQQSEIIARLAAGSLTAYLFVRLQTKVGGKAAPFVYCGALSAPSMEGNNPVTCLFDVLDYVEGATGALGEVYAWRSEVAPTPADLARHEAVLAKTPSRKQGHLQDKELRLALERHSMKLATAHYQSLGYSVEDTSRNRPYDLLCTKAGSSLRVEVKGTVSAGEAVLVTAGEVRAAREDQVATDLFVVFDIQVVREEVKRQVHGGKWKITSPWVPQDRDLEATQYRYAVPHL